MQIFVKRFIPLTLFLWLVLGLAVVAQTAGSPRLRGVHASSNAPNGDIYLDNFDSGPFFQNVSYRTVTGYRSVSSPGDHTVILLPAGVSPEDPRKGQVGFSFAEGRDYTVVAMGLLENLELRKFDDDNRPPEAGKTHFRVIHASPDTPPVNICLTNQSDCFVRDLHFGNPSGYYKWSAGTYNLDVRDASTGGILYIANNLNLENGVIYTLFIMGLLHGEPNLEVVVTPDEIRPPPEPPVNGAFLSPTLLILMAVIVTALLGGVGFFAWQHFMKSR
ncbi:MAG: DUF4397 domain-containing protein [Anaerolineae bacterium]|nr:DUF4397 domain-containing protein [Anaerolineae bacterium]